LESVPALGVKKTRVMGIRTFRSSEQRFPVGNFAPRNDFRTRNECSRELSFPGTNVPGNFRSWYSRFAFWPR